jgi:hypothetical protein
LLLPSSEGPAELPVLLQVVLLQGPLLLRSRCPVLRRLRLRLRWRCSGPRGRPGAPGQGPRSGSLAEGPQPNR